MRESQLPLDLPFVEGVDGLTESHNESYFCSQCGDRMARPVAVQTALDDYCSEACATEHTVDRMRRCGV